MQLHLLRDPQAVVEQVAETVEEQKDMGLPVPADFPASEEAQEFAYEFFVYSDGEMPDDARWTSGSSVDSKGEFGAREAEPVGEVPKLRKAKDAVTP